MTDDQEQIAAAEAYEDLYVPALFEQWASRVLDAISVQSGQRVLDVACGTGVLAREASARVGPAGSVAGVDPGASMLAIARRVTPLIDWQEGTAESLPFPDRSFDAVVSQFGLMYFPDRPGSVSEMLRVLVPGGKLSVAVWDHLENSAPYPQLVDLLQRLAGQSAADALVAPFVLGDTKELTALFERAGATDVSVTTHTGTARFPSTRETVEADLRGWLPVMGVLLEEELIQEILAEADNVLQKYVTDEGQVVFDAPAHIVTGAKA